MYQFSVCSQYEYIRVAHEWAQMLDNRCLISDQNMAFLFTGAIRCTRSKHGCKLVDNVCNFLVVQESFNITKNTEMQNIFIKQL